MKELIFKRTGRMHVAEEGNKRFVIHETERGAFYAKIFYRQAARPRPIASKPFGSRAEAVAWLSQWAQA